MQHWYSLRDPAMEDALIKLPTMRWCARIDMLSFRTPDASSILAFRHLVEKQSIGEQFFLRPSSPISRYGESPCRRARSSMPF